MAAGNNLSVFKDPEGGHMFVMGRVSYYLLFLYLLLLLAVSSVGGVCLLDRLSNLFVADSIPPTYMLMLWYCAPYTLVGSTLCYIRKLYLFAFHSVGDLSSESLAKLDLTGEACLWNYHATIVYFLTRPLFTVIATYFVLLAFAYGVTSLFFLKMDVNADGCIMIAAISFFTGFAGGKVLDGALSAGGKLVTEVLGTHADGKA